MLSPQICRNALDALMAKSSSVDINTAQHICNLLGNLANEYPSLVAVGGEAAPLLQAIAMGRDPVFQVVVRQLLRDIAQFTTLRFSERAGRVYCLRCLSCFGPHRVDLPLWQGASYYGCRSCGQSRTFFEGEVMAVLDGRMAEKTLHQGETLRVNWLARRRLFDFDIVEIIHATDENVERFAVQVGNDTDPIRRARYPEMRCVILSECRLSTNTQRILRKTFGQVETRAQDRNL